MVNPIWELKTYLWMLKQLEQFETHYLIEQVYFNENNINASI